MMVLLLIPAKYALVSIIIVKHATPLAYALNSKMTLTTLIQMILIQLIQMLATHSVIFLILLINVWNVLQMGQNAMLVVMDIIQNKKNVNYVLASSLIVINAQIMRHALSVIVAISSIMIISVKSALLELVIV